MVEMPIDNYNCSDGFPLDCCGNLDFNAIDVNPTVSLIYGQIPDEYHFHNLDTSCLGVLCTAIWDDVIKNFEMYYEVREIGGDSEDDFKRMLQSCLNRNADTFERHLEVYQDDIAKPILGRTETVTYDLENRNDRDTTIDNTYNTKSTNINSGQDVNHHVEVPADSPQYDVDRSRDKTDYGKTEINSNTGNDGSTTTDKGVGTQKGTVTTVLSDMGVRPNYQSMNGFLENNTTFIQNVLNVFEECFVPRYRRVIW